MRRLAAHAVGYCGVGGRTAVPKLETLRKDKNAKVHMFAKDALTRLRR